MGDVLQLMNRVSTFFQLRHNKVKYGSLETEIGVICQRLEQQSVRGSHGKYLTLLRSNVKAGYYTDFDIESIGENDWKWLEQKMATVKDSLTLHLYQRFPSRKILDASSIFDYNVLNFKKLNASELNKWGHDEMVTLLKHFGVRKKGKKLKFLCENHLNSVAANRLKCSRLLTHRLMLGKYAISFLQ